MLQHTEDSVRDVAVTAFRTLFFNCFNMEDIPGYEGLYAATQDGMIWSHPKNGKKGRFLRLSFNTYGYVFANMYKDRHNTPKTVHRLVAFTYIPNPENKTCINHKNGIRDDNRIENLEWCTQSENMFHSFRELGRKQHNMKKVGNFTKEGIPLEVFESTHEAGRKLLLSYKNISACALGKNKTCGGFIWKYI